MRGRRRGFRPDDEAPQDAPPADDVPQEPHAADPVPTPAQQAATGAYRVPSAIDDRFGFHGEHVVTASIEIACQWDARIWRRGPFPR